ncbi:DUF177 domain-containing protein [bacterium]|nr:MAG: DUF177 domain-containing protein [bacterium]
MGLRVRIGPAMRATPPSAPKRPPKSPMRWLLSGEWVRLGFRRSYHAQRGLGKGGWGFDTPGSARYNGGCSRGSRAWDSRRVSGTLFVNIDVGSILAGQVAELPISGRVPVETFESVTFPEPGEVDVTVSRASQGILLRGRVRVRGEGSCSRCLEPVSLDLDEEVDEAIVLPEGGEQRDPLALDNVLHGTMLDVDDLVRQTVDAALPLRLICREDCAGLCPRCGANRNDGACACIEEESDGQS